MFVHRAAGADEADVHGADFKAVQVKLAETRVSPAQLELKLALDNNQENPADSRKSHRDTRAVLDEGEAQLAALQMAKIRVKRLEETRVKTGDVSESAIECTKLRVQIAKRKAPASCACTSCRSSGNCAG